MASVFDKNNDGPVSKLAGLLKQASDVVSKLEREKTADDDEKTQLKNELEMVKRAYLQLQSEKTQFEQRSHEQELTLKDVVINQRRELDTLSTSERRVYCFIDGDGLIFSKALITQGRSGGLDAARLLTDAIHAQLVGIPEYQLWTYSFFNRPGLIGPLGVGKVLFDAFIGGFNSVGERAFMVDVGTGKEAADARVRELMQSAAQSSLTHKIYFGGCHDNGYVPVLESLITRKLGHKIILLPGHVEVAAGIKTLGLPFLHVSDLFETKRLGESDLPRDSTPPAASNSSTANGQAPTPNEPVNPKYLNTSIAFLHWNKPRPCNYLYILGECRTMNCKFGHDYTLRPGERDRLRKEANPCDSIKNDIICPRLGSCPYRHVCANGSACPSWNNGNGQCIAGGVEAHQSRAAAT